LTYFFVKYNANSQPGSLLHLGGKYKKYHSG
jgi:hypothetical protein